MSSSTTDAEAIEPMEITLKDVDTTVKGAERETPFIEAGDRDKLLIWKVALNRKKTN